jgi:hypothetical protein
LTSPPRVLEPASVDLAMPEALSVWGARISVLPANRPSSRSAHRVLTPHTSSTRRARSAAAVRKIRVARRRGEVDRRAPVAKAFNANFAVLYDQMSSAYRPSNLHAARTARVRRAHWDFDPYTSLRSRVRQCPVRPRGGSKAEESMWTSALRLRTGRRRCSPLTLPTARAPARGRAPSPTHRRRARPARHMRAARAPVSQRRQRARRGRTSDRAGRAGRRAAPGRRALRASHARTRRPSPTGRPGR